MSVRDAVEAELRELVAQESALGAAALVLAEQLDGSSSATSKSMCAKVLRETMDRVRELNPPKREGDRIDDLSARRSRRRRSAA